MPSDTEPAEFQTLDLARHHGQAACQRERRGAMIQPLPNGKWLVVFDEPPFEVSAGTHHKVLCWDGRLRPRKSFDL